MVTRWFWPYNLLMRTFIAIELPVAIQHHVRTVQQMLQDQLAQLRIPPCFNWTPSANIHLTVRFLGETDEQQRTFLAHELAALCAQHMAFSLVVHGVGCFPNFRAPRVVWQGIQGDLPALARLHAPVETYRFCFRRTPILAPSDVGSRPARCPAPGAHPGWPGVGESGNRRNPDPDNHFCRHRDPLDTQRTAARRRSLYVAGTLPSNGSGESDLR
ncbi:MAG: RNA 2',3'-cyclic phosphodiesterase [Chloroflexi bacterium]|nr:MAG: RNA 2',3'-cyclic phosphodiesterase [Chloroflexota bacterium]